MTCRMRFISVFKLFTLFDTFPIQYLLYLIPQKKLTYLGLEDYIHLFLKFRD